MYFTHHHSDNPLVSALGTNADTFMRVNYIIHVVPLLAAVSLPPRLLPLLLLLIDLCITINSWSISGGARAPRTRQACGQRTQTHGTPKLHEPVWQVRGLQQYSSLEKVYSRLAYSDLYIQ